MKVRKFLEILSIITITIFGVCMLRANAQNAENVTNNNNNNNNENVEIDVQESGSQQQGQSATSGNSEITTTVTDVELLKIDKAIRRPLAYGSPILTCGQSPQKYMLLCL